MGEPYIVHDITSETGHTTHYFGFSTRNVRLDDESLDDFQYESDCKIRERDVDAIAVVEQRLEYGAEQQKEMLVVSDRPAVKVREQIEEVLAHEND